MMNVFGTLTLKASTDWCYCLHGQRLSHHGYRPHCRYVFPTIGNLTLCNSCSVEMEELSIPCRLVFSEKKVKSSKNNYYYLAQIFSDSCFFLQPLFF